MKIRNLIVLFLLVIVQNGFGMDFVRKALAFGESDELKRQILDEKFKILADNIEKHRRKIMKQYLDEVVYTIEKGLYAKEEWQPGEVESLFRTLFSAKCSDETVEEAIERFEQS